MSDTINPYESTQTNLDEEKPLISQDFFTASTIEYLKASSPWMKFMGIMSFIGAGILIVVGLAIMLLFPIVSQVLDFVSAGLAAVSSVFGFIYLAMGIVAIFPARYLYNFASKIRLFIETKNERAMEIALRNNKSFWKFNGIVAIISLASIPVIFIISIFVALAGVLM